MNDSKLTNGQITKYSMMGLTQFMAMMPAFMYYRTFLQVNLKVPAEMLAVLVLIGTGVDFLLSLVAGPVVEKSTGGKWGKFRIFFATFPWIMFAGAIVVFIAPASIGSPLVKGLITIVG
ncbi:MAG: MFS transporter, partial [Oscillospiraceae bacterium]|nr:MFS transporter [Oscillospiraceae bacterium]